MKLAKASHDLSSVVDVLFEALSFCEVPHHNISKEFRLTPYTA